MNKTQNTWISGVAFKSRREGFSLIELIIVLVIVGLLISLVASVGLRTSDGERTGRVQKFSYAGAIWHTHEGELATEGIKLRSGKNGSSGGSVFEFSIDENNRQVIQQIQEAQRSQQVVTLQYHQRRLALPWNGSTSYFITNVIVSRPDAQKAPATTPQ